MISRNTVAAWCLLIAIVIGGFVACTDGVEWERHGSEWCFRYWDDFTENDGLYCRVEPGPVTERP